MKARRRLSIASFWGLDKKIAMEYACCLINPRQTHSKLLTEYRECLFVFNTPDCQYEPK